MLPGERVAHYTAAMSFRTLLLAALVVPLAAAADIEPSATTQVVMLGTGTPNAEPDRSGPAVAVVVNDTAYLVDAGAGVVRRAAAMAPTWGGPIAALEPERLGHAFLTHLHSDHTVGLPDLILTSWTLGRGQPLELFGPEGTRKMVEHIHAAYDADIKYRLYGLEPANNAGWRVDVHEVVEGPVFEDDNVRVVAFRVRHGTWPNAFGYRFETPDRVVVISGDAAPGGSLEEHAAGADILVHEVYSVEGFRRRDPYWQEYHSTNHTSAHEVGELASRVRPDLLVLYHVLFWGASAETILEEVGEKYAGDVVLADDLDVF